MHRIAAVLKLLTQLNKLSSNKLIRHECQNGILGGCFFILFDGYFSSTTGYHRKRKSPELFAYSLISIANFERCWCLVFTTHYVYCKKSVSYRRIWMCSLLLSNHVVSLKPWQTLKNGVNTSDGYFLAFLQQSNRSTLTPLPKLKKSWDNRREKQTQKVQWTELHFLRKESEWLHERDYGN